MRGFVIMILLVLIGNFGHSDLLSEYSRLPPARLATRFVAGGTPVNRIEIDFGDKP